MLEVYSPSGSEAEVGKLLNEEMRLLGFETIVDRVGNVVGEIGESGPRILLCGHMDTVPGELPVEINDGFLSGRGAVDAKSSLAAMITGASLARDRTINPFRVTVAAVVQEESSSSGIQELVSSGRAWDMAVFGEPSGLPNITIGYKGRLVVRVECVTQGGHSGSPWVSPNSADEVYSFWKVLRTKLLDNEGESKFHSVTGCLTRVMAAGNANSIPSSSSMEIDIRIPPQTTPEELIAKIKAARDSYLMTHPGVKLFVNVSDQTVPYLGPHDSVAVQAFRLAIRNTLQERAVLLKKTGTSDLNLFSLHYRIPMVAYGPGDSRLDHTDAERIRTEEYIQSIEIYARAINEFSRLASKTPMAKTLVS